MSVDAIACPAEHDPRTDRQRLTTRVWGWALVLAVGAGFVLASGGKLDLGPLEARLGMAAGEAFGPMGQVFGGWDPAIWPGELAPSTLWAWGEGGTPTSASVRWPAAIAGMLAGVVLASRVTGTLGLRAALMVAFCWFGSVALVDRSAGAGLDLVAGWLVVAAIDRVLGRGTGWVAGLWLALAFLTAGWPPVAIVLLVAIVLGRRGVELSPGLLLPPALAAAGWSAWALTHVPTEAWASALALPVTQKPAWFLALTVMALGLPWSPLTALAAFRSIREGWSDPGRQLVTGWLKAAATCLVAGTIIPGLAPAALVPALAGLALTAAACADSLWSSVVSPAARRSFLGLSTLLVIVWTAVVVGSGIYLASAVPYYRVFSITMIILVLPAGALIIRAFETGDSRRAVLAMVVVAIGVKLGHWGYYVPEWNYRRSQGPWGRAIGQWVPPRWPVYTTHSWPPDLAFAMSRPVRQLTHAKLLAFVKDNRPKHLLLFESEFTHWPTDAPALVKVATFRDEHGETRVLARTDGPFSWRLVRKFRDE